MEDRGKPHLRNFFSESIDEHGGPIFQGHKFGCFHYEAKADDPTMVAFLVHSLSKTKVPMDLHCSLPMGIQIQLNYNDFTAFFSLLGSKQPCYKMFPELKKLGKQDLLDLATTTARKKLEQVNADNVQLDSSLSGVAKRQRAPFGRPKAAAGGPSAEEVRTPPPVAPAAQGTVPVAAGSDGKYL